MDEYEASFGDGADFVDFSGDLRKMLKTADTKVEHWLSQDAVDALNEAIKAFIGVISEGSVVALENDKKKKKVLSPEHVVAGLEAKGFGEIARELEKNHGDVLTARKRKKKDDDGMTEEQMLELQKKLFAQAKAKQAF